MGMKFTHQMKADISMPRLCRAIWTDEEVPLVFVLHYGAVVEWNLIQGEGHSRRLWHLWHFKTVFKTRNLTNCFITLRISSWGTKNGPVCLCVCGGGVVKATLCTTSWVQDYVAHHGPALCTTDLCFVPWCTRGTYVRQMWGRPRHFSIFV